MAPAPMTSRRRGRAEGCKASRYDQTLEPSASSPGNCRARAPVARMMCGAASISESLSRVTCNLCGPAKRAWPLITLTLFFFIRCSTPRCSWPATARERATMAGRSTCGVPTVTPKRPASRTSRKTSAERNSALVGMQPQFRQMPPSWAFSTSAVRMPSCTARIAAT
ncbi:hypothetical protein D3C81_1753020 [compost metagenome]